MQITNVDRDGIGIVQRILADPDAPIDRVALAATLQAIVDRIEPTRLNINAEIEVALTADGRKIVDAHWSELRQSLPERFAEGDFPDVRTDPETGRSRLLLWKLMTILGPKMSQGGPMLFDATIGVVDPRV